MDNDVFEGTNEENVNEQILKNITKVAKRTASSFNEPIIPDKIEEDIDLNGSTFRPYNTAANLPLKIGFWTKVKNALFYEIKVELTPYQQKVEDEVNEFLHQEVTFKSFKNLMFKEITFGKK